MSASTKTKSTRDDRGMTTAEYAVGTVATVTAAGVLITIFKQPWFQELLIKLIKMIIEIVTGFSF